MRAHLGTHREGKLHLVKRSLQIGGRNDANNSAAFVALDSRMVSTEWWMGLLRISLLCGSYLRGLWLTFGRRYAN